MHTGIGVPHLFLRRFAVLSLVLLSALFAVARSASAADAWPPPGRTFVVGFAQDTMANDWRAAQVYELQRALAAYPFITFRHTDAGGQTAQQIIDVENLLAQGVDLLVTSPRDIKAMTPIIAKVHARGVPVVLLTRRVEGDQYTAFVGNNDRQIGSRAARFLIEKTGGKGRVVMLRGVPTATTAIDRAEGFLKELATARGMTLVADKAGNYLRSDSIKAMDEVIAQGIKFDAIFAQSDSMATGARLALKKAGVDLRGVRIVGIDYIREAQDAIRAGEQDASFVYPTLGKEGAEVIIKILKGETVPKDVIIQSDVVTRDNVDRAKPVF